MRPSALALLLALILIPSIWAVPACTTATDILYRPDLSRYTGTITVSGPAFIAADSTYVPSFNGLLIRVFNGNFSTCLIPTTGAAQLVTPNSAGLFYTARYTPQISTGASQVQFWSVPASCSGGCHLSDWIVNPAPISPYAIGLSQLLQGGAAVNECLVWNGSSWGHGQCASAFPFTITAQTSLTVTHNFNNLNVDLEIYDGSGNIVFPKGWRVVDANSIQVSFDASFTGRGVVK